MTYLNPYTWTSGKHVHTLSTPQRDGVTPEEIQEEHDEAVGIALEFWPQSQ